MKKIYFSFSIFFLLLFFSFQSFSQADCGNNAGFEFGTTGGWVCKSGTYGDGIWSGFCPDFSIGSCPTFNTVLGTPGCINNNGNNALSNTTVDRHTIMTSAYVEGGPAGMDPNSGWTVPVLAPGGGSYSFRLGDAVASGFGSNPNRLARAEAIRLTFNVNASNAGFTYQYAVFLQDPGHLPEEQPRFEVFVTQPDSNDQIIPCGHYKFVSGSANPSCAGTRDSSTFKYGAANWRYTDWTAVGLDLSGYIGQNISVEFRTSDCFPSQNVTYSVAGVQTTCSNVLQPNGTWTGVCCWGTAPQVCTTVSTCGIHSPGTHSAYAYIDAFCSPINSIPAPVCTGDDSVQIWAPPGYKDWKWACTGDTTEFTWLHFPRPGDSCVVNMKSQAGCPTKSTVRLTGTDVLTSDTVFCEGAGGNVDLTATITVPGTYTYTWTGPPTIGLPSANLTTSIPIPNTTSTYSLSVADPAAGCIYRRTMTIVINPKPQVNISPDTSICVGVNVQLSSSGPSISCSWSPPTYLDNQLSCTPLAVNPTSTTTYIVTLTDTNSCTNTDTTTITINPPALVSANAIPPIICQGESTILSASGGMIFYTWFPSLGSASDSVITVTPSATTTYTVAVLNATGCADTTTVDVTVNPVPNASVNPNPSICLGDTTTLSATGGTFYSWVPGTGLDLPNDSITTAHPATTTTYTVYVSYPTGCKDDTIVTVNIAPIPDACATGSEVCVGQPAQLDASCSPSGYVFSWLPDPTLSDLTIPDPIAITDTDRTYTVIVWTSINCPPDTATASVIIHPIPSVTASPDVKIQAGTSTQLTSTGTGVSYTWFPSTGLICSTPCEDPNPLANPLVTTQYVVTTVDSFGCINTDTVIVTVEDILTLYVPSAFLPVSYDDRNNIFYAFGVGIWQFEFYIFDRWGILVFESHDPSIGWDGTYNGSMAVQDVYTYLAKAKSITGKSITKTGPVTILR